MVLEYLSVLILVEITSTICVKHPKVDKFVSGGIIKEGFWEKDIVMKAMRGVDNYPTAVFLDIGANIGDIAGQVWSCFLTWNIGRNVHCDDRSDEEESGCSRSHQG